MPRPRRFHTAKGKVGLSGRLEVDDAVGRDSDDKEFRITQVRRTREGAEFTLQSADGGWFTATQANLKTHFHRHGHWYATRDGLILFDTHW